MVRPTLSAVADVPVTGELSALRTLGPRTDHRDAEGVLRAAGWTACGAGDWAIALRSPAGAYAARISPFDPAGPYNAALYRRAAHTGQVPRLEAEVALEGGAHLMILEFLHVADPGRAGAFHRSVLARAPEVAELADLVRSVHADACRELPWCGPVDTNPSNVMRRADGGLVLIDPFYADGPDLYGTVRSDPACVAAAIPSDRRRHMFDLPLRSSGPPEPGVLEEMRWALADVEAGPR